MTAAASAVTYMVWPTVSVDRSQATEEPPTEVVEEIVEEVVVDPLSEWELVSGSESQPVYRLHDERFWVVCYAYNGGISCTEALSDSTIDRVRREQ